LRSKARTLPASVKSAGFFARAPSGGWHGPRSRQFGDGARHEMGRGAALEAGL